MVHLAGGSPKGDDFAEVVRVHDRFFQGVSEAIMLYKSRLLRTIDVGGGAILIATPQNIPPVTHKQPAIHRITMERKKQTRHRTPNAYLV